MTAALVPLLTIVFPLAMAGGCLVLRRMPRTVLAVGFVTLALESWLVLSAAAPGRGAAAGLDNDGIGRLVLVAACAGALLATLAAAAGEPGEYFVAVELLMVSCAACIALAREPLLVAGLLLVGGLLGGVQLADRPTGSVALLRPRTLGVALRYTVLIALGGLLMLLGITLFGDTAARATSDVAPRLGYAMLVFGYAVRCGLLPFHAAQADLVVDAPPSAAVLHAGLLAALALPVLLSISVAQPELLTDNQTVRRLLIGLGAVSALAGGALGIFADARRGLALLASANLGLLTIGLGMGSRQGVQAALIGAFGHILGIGLAALGLALLPCSSTRRRQDQDTAARWAGTVALVSGVLLLAGVPPLAGFAPRLLLLAAAWQQSYLVAAIVVAGVTLMAPAAGRVLSDALRPRPTSGPHEADDEPAALANRLEPAAQVSPGRFAGLRVLPAITVVVSLVIAGGVWLLPLTTRVDTVLHSFLP